MAKFHVYGSDGKQYEVESPDMDTAIDDLEKSIGSQKSTRSTEGTFGRTAVDPQRLLALARGTPIVGQLLPEPQLAKSSPATNKALEFTGGMMGIGAPTQAVSRGAAMLHPGRLTEMGAQGLFGGTVGALDSGVGGGTPDEVKNQAIISTLGGAAGPVLGKTMSPTKEMGRKSVESLARLPEEALETGLRHRDSRRAAVDTARAFMQHPVVSGLGGAAFSSMTGIMHPFLGAAVGAAAPKIVQGGAHLMANKAFHNQSTQDILNIIAQTAGQQIHE